MGRCYSVSRTLERSSTPGRIRAEQEVTRRYAAIMPFWMSSVIVSCLPVLALSRRTSAFLRILALAEALTIDPRSNVEERSTR
ncbi:MAG: hypothetical protein M3N00_08030 [Actinomycetota bacterium]|nr:hypothetical protein [Actinomycetota bacterium]